MLVVLYPQMCPLFTRSCERQHHPGSVLLLEYRLPQLFPPTFGRLGNKDDELKIYKEEDMGVTAEPEIGKEASVLSCALEDLLHWLC
ncbi:MAG: hypothetical protein NVSMB27_19770 [Ktedonobacteraceae bacterium]